MPKGCRKKVAIVKNWPVPTNQKDLQRFWGLANYFRKFIMAWSNLVAPLQVLLKQADVFNWTAECDTAFTGLKDALCNAPVLALPDLDRPFEVICDACGVGLGAVLIQDGRPIAFDGKRMNPAEQNYAVGEKELLAVIHALELWRCYLDGAEVTVVTDHSPNTFFATKAVLSSRQARWAERLSRFQFTWENRPGRVNVADPISRHPTFIAGMVIAAVRLQSSHMTATAQHATPLLAAVINSATANADIQAQNAAAAEADADLLTQIMQGYTQDPWFERGSNTAWLDLYQGLYYRGDALVVPDARELKNAILWERHDAKYSGHVGYHRTYHHVHRMYW